MNFSGVGFHTDVGEPSVFEGRREIARAASDVEQGPAGACLAAGRLPQIADHRRGVSSQCAVEPGRVGLLEAELRQQPHRPRQCRAPGEDVGGSHKAQPYAAVTLTPMSNRAVRSVLLLCWRDTGHPQGGGSEAYLQRIGAQLAASGVEVTLRTARYPGARRREVKDGVQISRAGGPYSVYIWAGLAMVAARIGIGPLRRARPDVVVDTQNGLPFMAR